MNLLPLGMSETPPGSPWGINFGGGLNSTAIIIECRNRGLRPDWILFADTGSELPGTLEHVERMREWCGKEWSRHGLVTVRWIRRDGEFEPLHENCLRTGHLPSKAYGLAGCTTKWKIQPMERWRKSVGMNKVAFAVGYDAGESRRIQSACKRGDDPNFTAWYPLVAWGIDREGCKKICDKDGNNVNVNCYEYAIKTEDEYKVVLSAIDKLMDIDPPAGSIPGDILLWLSFSAQEFEAKQMRGKGPFVTCKNCGNPYSRPDWCDNCGSVKPNR